MEPDWCKNLRFALLAVAGIWIPSAASAQEHSVGRSEASMPVLPPAVGYAYAALPNGSYRPTSAWVDDLDSPAGYTQDNGASSWLYDAAYAEIPNNSRRPSPRTGNQAMHRLAEFRCETSAVFEAGKAYTFSIWTQNDEILNDANGLFMYIFDGNILFSDANALTKRLFTTEIRHPRGGAMTAAQSSGHWAEIEIVAWRARRRCPEIGHPLGIGFFARKDVRSRRCRHSRVDPIEKFFMLHGSQHHHRPDGASRIRRASP